MTLSAILADLYRRLALPATPAATETTRLTAFVNTTHRQILGLPGMESLRNDTVVIQMPFVPYPPRRVYGLPRSASRIQRIVDMTTQRKLTLSSLQELRALDPAMIATGSPDRYVVLGLQAVRMQPNNPCQFALVSSSATDTTIVVHLEGLLSHDSGGNWQEAVQVTLAGTSPVTPVLHTPWVEVTKFYLSAPATGHVTLFQDAVAGAQISAIWPGHTHARYLGVQLYPMPLAPSTFELDYVRNVFDMSNPTDEPFLPEDFHWLLVEGALLKEWTKRDDDRRVAAEREYSKGLSALKYFISGYGDDLRVSGQGVSWTPSRYGPYFPAMRY